MGKNLLLLAIILAGLFLRLYNLGGESVWTDEAATVRRARGGILAAVFEPGNFHPFYTVLMHFWGVFFGYSEYSIRLPAAVFGTLAVYAMYRVGVILFDEEVGLLSALLLGLSAFHISFSQEARGFSLMVLLCLCSMYYFISLLDRLKKSHMVGYVAASMLLLYTHPYGIFLVLAQNIYIAASYVILRGNNGLGVRVWILLQSIVAVFYMPWAVIAVRYMPDRLRVLSWLPKPSLNEVFWTLGSFTGTENFHNYLLGCLFLLLALISLPSIKADARKAGITLLWFLTPIIAPYVVSRVWVPIDFYPKYKITASLALYLLVARGLTAVNSRTVRLAVIALIVYASLTNIHEYYSNVWKGHWREITGYVEDDYRMGDVILFNRCFRRQPFNYYSTSKTGLSRKICGSRIYSDKTIQDYQRIWFIMSYKYPPRFTRFMNAFNNTHQLKTIKEFDWIMVILVEKKTEA